MIGRVALAVALCAATTAAARAADPLSYDDPAMHFQAPAGWTRVDVPPADPSGGGDDAPPVAAFAFHRGQGDQRTIVITVHDFEGALDSFESNQESELRRATDGTFVDKKERTALANGMPAWFLKISSGNEAGAFVRRYDYLMIDGRRGIDVAFIGRQGDFDDADVKAALASLYVVAYPRGRS